MTKRFKTICGLVLVAGAMCVTAAMPVRAQMTGAPPAGYRQAPGVPASTVPAPLREIGFDQRVGEPLPLDTIFRDETGRDVVFGRYFTTRPVILAFVYYDCPMLCTQIVNALVAALRTMSMTPGRDFEVVLVSFDPREQPARAAVRKAETLVRYDRPGSEAGWHFLTGDEASIRRLTGAAGFRYVWDEPTKQFAHPAGIVIATPDGRPSRYLFGLEYGPRDVRLALTEASEGRIGTVVDALLLYCYHYDPMTGRYGLVVMRMLRVAGVLTVMALGAFILLMLRLERRGRLRRVPAPFATRPAHRT